MLMQPSAARHWPDNAPLLGLDVDDPRFATTKVRLVHRGLPWNGADTPYTAWCTWYTWYTVEWSRLSWMDIV